MKSSWLIVGGALLFASGCRLIIGMENITIVDGGADPAEGGQDAGDALASNDSQAPPDAPGDGPPPDFSACLTKNGNECLRCCKETLRDETPRMERALVDLGCACGGAACTTECAQETCMNPPGSPQPNGPCAPCLDNVVKNGGLGAKCKDAIGACVNQPNRGCANVMNCIQGCR